MKKLFFLTILLISGLGAAAQTNEVEPSKYCDSPEHRQMDFWVGDWVVWSGNEIAGHNSVKQMLGTCMIMENWEGAKGSVGHSFNMFDEATGKWRQTWVDNSGTWIEFVGNWNEEDGQMQLKGTHYSPSFKKDVLYTLDFTPNNDGSVRQLWKQSGDAGKTWRVVFDGKYVRE